MLSNNTSAATLAPPIRYRISPCDRPNSGYTHSGVWI